LLTPTLRRVIEETHAQFDVVIVDTPPINLITDAAQVVSSVDGVILVVRAGATEREALEIALERLERAGARLLGIVLNDVSLPRYHRGYYGGRSYVVG
jgi:Mrp family chromosome partitioning ATPase